MDEVQGPVVAIALVLAAVFIPMAFIPGVTGQLYKQFAVTVAVSTMFSATGRADPYAGAVRHAAQAARARASGAAGRLLASSNGSTGSSTAPMTTTGASPGTARGARWWCSAILGGVILAIGGLQRITPTGFVPDEDKGAMFMQVILPEAASQQRTVAVARKVKDIVRQMPGVANVQVIAGYDLISGTAASNGAFMIIRLKPWDERPGRDQHASTIVGKLAAATRRLPEAIAIPFNPPALPGFGNVSGFSMMLQARAGQSADDLAAVAGQFIAAAQKRPEIGRITTTFSA